MKSLVVFFSAERGRTASVAKTLALTMDADIFEIRPENPYSKSDLNYMNPLSRCNREHISKSKVPVNSEKVKGFKDYDTVLIGFPIWYGCAPNVVNTFCSGYNFTGKKVAIFATSGGSGMGRSAEKLQPYVTGAKIVGSKLCNGANDKDLEDWAKNLWIEKDR